MNLFINSIGSFTISLIISLIIGIIFIPILKRFKINQNLSIYLEEEHRSKKNTPTMGGIIFVLSTLICMTINFALNKINLNYNFLIVLFSFVAYAMIGFIDDFLIIKRHNNNGLSINQKFLLEIVISVIFFYLFMKANNEPLLWLHSLNLRLEIGWIYGLFILFVLTSSTNAVNITDGLDGLAGGLSLISILAFGIITYYTGWLDGYEEITCFCFALSGSLLGFLFFNIYPARIFMGDTGSLALGAVLGSIAILTRREILLILIGIVFVIETITCIIQILFYKLFNKRIFPITPIHHTFERMGIKENILVRIFWIVGLVSALIGIILGVYL